MKINTQRRIDRILGTFLCRIFSLIPHRRYSEIGNGKLSPNFLIILLSEMGSLVLTKPMFDRIKKKYSHASIHALCFEKNKEVVEILNLIPSERILTVRNDSLWALFWDSIRVLIQMRRSKIDIVLDCELFSRISSAYSFLSGARIRVGFHPHTQEGLYRGNYINRPVLYNPYLHISEQFLNLADAIESVHTPTVKRRIGNGPKGVRRIEISEQEKDELSSELENDFPGIAGKELILLYPSGGLIPIRAWPLESFCLVAENLIHHGYAVGIIGMEEDRLFAAKILSHCHTNACIDLTGYTKTVRKLMVIFHFTSLLITNDGGPGHFASLTPIPTIILYGPETPILYGSLDEKSVSFYVSMSCSPCLSAYNHRDSPCDGDNICLKSITPEEVLKKAYELLHAKKRLENIQPARWDSENASQRPLGG